MREAVEVIENQDLLLSRMSSMVMFGRTALVKTSALRRFSSIVMLFESFILVVSMFVFFDCGNKGLIPLQFAVTSLTRMSNALIACPMV